MPVFSFDEEEQNLDNLSLHDIDNVSIDGVSVFEPFTSSTADNGDLSDIMPPTSSSYSSSFSNSNFLNPSSFPNQHTRKSSIYRRLSIKSVNSIDIGTNNQSIVSAIDGDDEEKNSRDTAILRDHKNVKLSDFEPIKVLGHGAYGKVYLVKNKLTGKLFAQKQLKKAEITVGREMERTISEKEILSRLSHPNIVKLFYALHDRHKIYLLLEYVPGGELFMHLSTKKFLSEDVTAYYAAEMALALNHLHTIGVVYRDLKPENCLLDLKGHLVLTDFGLSKVASGTEENGVCKSIIGTPEYMAPEILKGEEYSYSVDWWSLGTVIYDMMCGKPPFTANNSKAITNKIIKNKVSYPFYFSADAKDLLNKLLNKNPAKRMNVDDDFDKFKKHRFFRKINWNDLVSQNVDSEPPIKPIITDPILAENFDEKFTSMKISHFGDFDEFGNPIRQPINIDSLPKDTNEDFDFFHGFTYTATNSYIEKYL